MSDTLPTAPTVPGAAPQPAGRSWARALIDEAPYLLMLILGYAGVVVSGGDTPNLVYWMVLAPVFGLLCIAVGWKAAASRGLRLRLIWTQAAHWAAFLGAMLLFFLPSVRGMVGDDGTEIGVLLLVGLGTFVAGVHAGSWRIVAVGAVLAVSVPAAAVLQQSVLMLTTIGVVVMGLAAAFVWARARG